MRLSVGPISYYWERNRVLDFYEQLASSPVDIVYLGEVICAKRRLIRLDDWLEIGERLEQAGKEVVLSTLTLLEAASDVAALKKACLNGRFTVEANDISAVQFLAAEGLEFVTGPSVNIYNQRTLGLLAGKGLRRWVLPVELGLEALRDLQSTRPDGVETEVFALGRLPLAYSARCYTARSLNLPKDDCQFRCIDYPDGRLLKTREGEEFLVLNGVQTQSARTHEALSRVADLRAMGVDVLRVSPQAENTFSIIGLFDRVLHGSDPEPLMPGLAQLLPTGVCNGYLAGEAGMQHEVR